VNIVGVAKPAGSEAGRRIAGAQHDGDGILLGLGVEGHRGHHRQIAPRVVVAVEEGELLLPVGGIVGGIQVDRDAPGSALEPPAMVLDDRLGQHVPHRQQLAPPHGVLEPRQRGLRGQGRPRDRIAVDQQLVDRVVGQPGRVVAVGVAAGDPKDALPEQLERLMLDLARLPRIVETRGQSLGQPELGIDRLQKDGPAIRAGVRCVEAGDDRLRESLALEGDLRYTGCGHRASSCACREARRHRFYSTFEWLGGSSVSLFANYPG